MGCARWSARFGQGVQVDAASNNLRWAGPISADGVLPESDGSKPETKHPDQALRCTSETAPTIEAGGVRL